MKVLGVVEWTQRDKNGQEIAGVKPLYEFHNWRLIDAEGEFPSQGQAFWPNAQNATKDTLIVFRAETNLNSKYEFKVVEPKPVCEVLDLRRCATIEEARVALINGIKVPGPAGTRSFLIWCGQDVLVGPVELRRGSTGVATLGGTNKHALALYAGAKVESLFIERSRRLVRVDDEGPSGQVDWDDDALVLRRALDVAVRVARSAGHDLSMTRRSLDEAARALATQAGPNVGLDSYRLERAITLVSKADFVARHASEVVALLSDHPSIKTSVDTLRAAVRADTEHSVRAELQRELANENAELKKASDARALARQQCDECEKELSRLKGELANARSQVTDAVKAAEAAVDDRLRAAIDSPHDLLAEVSVLRPFLGCAATAETRHSLRPAQPALDWVGARGDDVGDKIALSRVLTSAARACGVDPALMLQIHAAVVARLMPVTVGPGALAALKAYADAVCAGRILIVHVSPSAIDPHDLQDTPGGGLWAAASAARDVDGLSLVVLEGVNRAPIEGSVVPILQLVELGMTPLVGTGGLRLAASLVAGATTVPVTPQVWSHAAAIYSEPNAAPSRTGATGEVKLSSDLLVPGDEPSDAIAALLDSWPDCRELGPTMRSFGSALARFYPEQRVRNDLLNGLVLPYVATAFSLEEQAEAVARAGDPDGAISRELRRLRRSLT
jgi:hypothetical protein